MGILLGTRDDNENVQGVSESEKENLWRNQKEKWTLEKVQSTWVPLWMQQHVLQYKSVSQKASFIHVLSQIP